MTEQRLQEIEASIGRIECPECGGSGVYLDVPTGNEACDECDGSGMVSQFPPADELIAAVRTLTADLAQARVERDAARRALARRQHQKGCPSLGIGGAVERNCTCGVNALRAELDAVRQNAAAAQAEVTDRERIIGELQAANQRLAKDSARVFACWDEGHRLAVAEASKRQDAEAALATLREQLQAAQAPCLCCSEVTQPCQHGCKCSVDPTPAQEGQA